jgi:hypothetical protein
VVKQAGGGRLILNRFALVASLAALSLAASASPAPASVTIGQTEPPGGGLYCGGSAADIVQPAVSFGTSYAVPLAGRITSWTTGAAAPGGQAWTMKVWREVPGAGLTYVAVGHDGPHTLIGGVVNTFPANVPVQPGDLLGLNVGPSGGSACFFPVGGETFLYRVPSDLADGQSGAFITQPDGRINISAVVEPSNSFTLGKPKLNKKKGTATLKVSLPNPGILALGGKGVKWASAAGAVIAKTVNAPGAVKLVIRAKGKQAKKLKRNGKVKLKTKITFTPTGGEAATQTRKLKLRRR